MVTNKAGLSRCVGLFVLLVGGVWGQLPVWGQPPASATVPYVPKANGGQILVQVLLNGRYKATFALDTGCTWNLITAQLAKRMGLSMHAAQNNDGSPLALNGTEVNCVEVEQFKMGETSLSNDLIVVDAKQSKILDDLHIDGIIGVRSMAGKLLYIDSQHHQVSLWEAELTDALRNTLVSDAPSVIQGRAGEDGLLHISAHIEDRVPADMVLDTGASDVMIMADVARLTGKKPVESKKQNTISTYFGTIPIESILIEKLTFDIISGDPVELGNSTIHYSLKEIEHFPGATVGMAVFTFFKTLIDFKTLKIYLSPALGSNSGLGLGIEVEIHSGGTVVIAGTTPGFPAEKAGVLSGDEVIKIDGKPIPHETEALKQVLQTKFVQSAGSRVVLTVRRKGETKLRNLTVIFIKAQKPASVPSSNPAKTDTLHP